MNDLPRQKLGEIIAKHGTSIIENPRRCEGLLRDYCGSFRREISVLTMALEERVPLDLLAAKSTPHPVLFGRLTQRLCDNLALSEQAAHWSVYTWAFALGVISDAESKVIEQQSVQQTQKTTIDLSADQNNVQLSKAQNKQSEPHKTTVNQSSVQKSVIVSATGGDYAAIGEALKTVAPGMRLLIRPGIYNESIIIDKNIEIVGDGAAKDIVIQSANSSCLQIRAEKAVVRGITLRGRGAGYGNAFFAVDVPRGVLFLEDCDISSDSLSCVAIHGVDANPTIKNCRIHNGADSGFYFFDNARGQIIDCDIYHNANVNLAITQGANPTVKNCRIFDGENGGIVVWGNGATGTIEDCEITNHRLANVGISQAANPIFRRCIISGGRDSGVFVQQNGYGVFEECNIYENAKAEIAVTDGSNTILRGCTVHNGRESGIFVGSHARALVESCNIYDNADAGVSVYGESFIAIRRCNIHRNGTVAARVKENSRASVEESDLRGNRIAAWESEYGVVIERTNNRE